MFETKEKLLFICSKNKWRSPTAELIFKNHPDYDARSAGTSKHARIKVNAKLILWADFVFVMETRHRDLLRMSFDKELKGKRLVVLHIPDEYQFGDEKLIELLKDKLTEYLNI